MLTFLPHVDVYLLCAAYLDVNYEQRPIICCRFWLLETCLNMLRNASTRQSKPLYSLRPSLKATIKVWRNKIRDLKHC